MIKWCIITEGDSDTDINYLGWQPYIWDDGYSWTDKKGIKEILEKNTLEHPFLFDSKEEAIAHLKTLGISQKCRVIRVKLERSCY